MSLMTLITPSPSAPPTSNLPCAFNGSSTWDSIGNPLTWPWESAVTVSPFAGPPHWIWIVKRSLSPFIIVPIIAAPLKRRPNAAVMTGLVSWALLASSTISFDVMANARIWLSAAVALTI